MLFTRNLQRCTGVNKIVVGLVVDSSNNFLLCSEIYNWRL